MSQSPQRYATGLLVSPKSVVWVGAKALLCPPVGMEGAWKASRDILGVVQVGFSRPVEVGAGKKRMWL